MVPAFRYPASSEHSAGASAARCSDGPWPASGRPQGWSARSPDCCPVPRGDAAQPPSTPLAATTPPDSLGLIYFLTLTEHGMGEGLGQDRLHAVLRDVDKSLAAQPNRAYQVKLLYGSDDKLRGDRQPAGLLNRRVVRRSVEVTHFDEVVTSVHASLRRDLAEVGTTATGIERPGRPPGGHPAHHRPADRGPPLRWRVRRTGGRGHASSGWSHGRRKAS